MPADGTLTVERRRPGVQVPSGGSRLFRDVHRISMGAGSHGAPGRPTPSEGITHADDPGTVSALMVMQRAMTVDVSDFEMVTRRPFRGRFPLEDSLLIPPKSSVAPT